MKYPDDISCLSTGFDSWRSFKDLKAGKPYTCYVCMQETSKSNLTGDAYVFDGDELVLATSGIRFQRMKKIVMQSLLLPGGSAAKLPTSTKAPQSKVTPAVQKTSHKPVTSKASIESIDSSSSSSSHSESGPGTPATEVNDQNVEIVNKLLAAVAAESGYAPEDMDEETSFTDMGLDSLMAITTIANLKGEMGVELPATFFIDNPTIG